MCIRDRALAMVISFAGCKDNSSNKVQPEEMVEYEIAMITDDSLVMDCLLYTSRCV